MVQDMEFNYAQLRGFIIEHFGNIRNFSKFLGIEIGRASCRERV